MKVGIYSRERMEELLSKGPLENTAVISFCDPPRRRRHMYEEVVPIDYSATCDYVMQIRLHDLDPEALSEVGLTVERYFPEADALAAFIYRAREEGREILCQCEYGQSRSAGCAAAILEHFEGRGIDVFADYRYYPNQLVYHKVFDALGRYRDGADAQLP